MLDFDDEPLSARRDRASSSGKGREITIQTRIPSASFNRRSAKIDPPGVHTINGHRELSSTAAAGGGWERVSR